MMTEDIDPKETTKQLRDAQKKLQDGPDDKSYDVGYKKPPTSTRFNKGESGNPNGRPKGSKNKPSPISEHSLHQLILNEAYSEITVHDKGKPVRIPMIRAIIKSLAVNAAKGDHRSQQLMLKITQVSENKIDADKQALFEGAVIYVQECEKEVIKARKERRPPPKLIPHPDDIEINVRTGEVFFTGPMTQDEYDKLDSSKENKERLKFCIERLESQDLTDRDEEFIQETKQYLYDWKKTLEIIERGYSSKQSN